MWQTTNSLFLHLHKPIPDYLGFGWRRFAGYQFGQKNTWLRGEGWNIRVMYLAGKALKIWAKKACCLMSPAAEKNFM